MKTLGSFSKQKGIGTLTLISYAISITVLVLVAIKVVPPYYDGKFLVVEALESVANKPNLKEMSKIELRSAVLKFFNMNNIRGAAEDSLKVVRRKEGLLVNVNYEVRNNIFSNIDVVMSFQYQLNATTGVCCEYIVADVEQK